MSKYALLDRYPVSTTQQTAAGRLPIPYHVYDGHGTLIGGTADLAGVRDLLQNDQVVPLETESGRALMGVWIVDFSEASLESHNELQFSILVAHQSQNAVADHPLAILKALLDNPAARMFSTRLWNNSDTAVAYNRELLGLNAENASGTISRADGLKTFRFVNGDNQLLCEGDVVEAPRPSPRVGWTLLCLMGLRQTLRALREPYLAAKVVNPISESFPANLDAQTYLAAESPVVQFFDPATDALILGEPYATQFDFQPQFIEHFAPFRFVYLHPQASG